MARRNALSVNDVISRVLSECDESDISDIFEGIIHYNSKKFCLYYNKDESSSCDESVDNSTGITSIYSDLNGKFLHKYTSTYNNIDDTTQRDVRDFDTESGSESHRSRSPLSDEGTPSYLYYYPNHE